MLCCCFVLEQAYDDQISNYPYLHYLITRDTTWFLRPAIGEMQLFVDWTSLAQCMSVVMWLLWLCEAAVLLCIAMQSSIVKLVCLCSMLLRQSCMPLAPEFQAGIAVC
jgi:hypothetical protein